MFPVKINNGLYLDIFSDIFIKAEDNNNKPSKKTGDIDYDKHGYHDHDHDIDYDNYNKEKK